MKNGNSDLCYDCEINGISNLCDGPIFFGVNHRGLIDVLVVSESLPSPLAMAVSSRLLFKNEEPRKTFFYNHINGVPIEVHAGKEYIDLSIKNMSRILQSNTNLAVFPEGSYIPGEVVTKGHTGMVRALFDSCDNGVFPSLIPVALKYNQLEDLDYWGSTYPNHIVITILPKIDYYEYYSQFCLARDSGDTQYMNIIMHELTDLVMKSISEVNGYDYDDNYTELYSKKTFFFPNGSEHLICESDALYDSYSSDVEEFLMKKNPNI